MEIARNWVKRRQIVCVMFTNEYVLNTDRKLVPHHMRGQTTDYVELEGAPAELGQVGSSSLVVVVNWDIKPTMRKDSKMRAFRNRRHKTFPKPNMSRSKFAFQNFVAWRRIQRVHANQRYESWSLRWGDEQSNEDFKLNIL